MLKIIDLRHFCEAFQMGQPKIKETLVLASDEDYDKFVQKKMHKRNEAILVAVIPSANLDYKSEDNYKFKNHLHFIIMQKEDDKDSYNNYIKTLEFTQELILELFKFIHEKYGNFKECLFNDFDMSGLAIDPVTNYLRTSGYELSIPLNTKMV